MSTATYTHSQTGSLRHYIADVSHAIRALVAALFAAQERQYIAQEVTMTPVVSERNRQKSRIQLIALSNECYHLSPNLAGELRNLASRD